MLEFKQLPCCMYNRKWLSDCCSSESYTWGLSRRGKFNRQIKNNVSVLVKITQHILLTFVGFNDRAHDVIFSPLFVCEEKRSDTNRLAILNWQVYWYKYKQ